MHPWGENQVLAHSCSLGNLKVILARLYLVLPVTQGVPHNLTRAFCLYHTWVPGERKGKLLSTVVKSNPVQRRLTLAIPHHDWALLFSENPTSRDQKQMGNFLGNLGISCLYYSLENHVKAMWHIHCLNRWGHISLYKVKIW